MDGQATKWRRNIVENFNRLSMAHERYRRQTDRRPHNEHEREFAFAKKESNQNPKFNKSYTYE